MGNNNIFIHMLGFIVVSAGLALAEVTPMQLSFWLVMAGVSIVYFNA